MQTQRSVFFSHSILTTAAALGLVGCGGAQTPAAAPGEAKTAPAPSAAPASAGGEKFDIETALKREASGLTERAAEDAAHSWKVKVPSTGEPKLSLVEKIGLVEIPIGSEAAVRCQVFPEAGDPAGTLYSVIKQSSQQVEYQQLAPVAVELFGGNPAIFMEALYLANTPRGKLAGGLKVAVLSREDHELLCLHDELGYRDTFRKVSAAFFGSFQPAGVTKDPATYTEVSVTKLDETPVGFSVTRLLPGEKPGEREYHYSSTSLIPTSPKELIFEDNFSVTLYDAKGRIAQETHIEATQGEIAMQLKLARGADGKYAYEGQVGGKPQRGQLNAPHGLSSSLETAALIKKKLKAGAFEEKRDEYQPSIDPANVVQVTYAHAKDAPPRQVTMKIGERTVTTEVDDEGMPKSGWFAIGQHKLKVERLRVDGRP
jgi:hypothetical protein